MIFSNAANEHRVTVDTRADYTMKDYFSRKIVKLVELGNRLQNLTTNDNFFFEEHYNAKKVTLSNEVNVTPDEIAISE